jgi:hypothetical protein
LKAQECGAHTFLFDQVVGAETSQPASVPATWSISQFLCSLYIFFPALD